MAEHKEDFHPKKRRNKVHEGMFPLLLSKNYSPFAYFASLFPSCEKEEEGVIRVSHSGEKGSLTDTDLNKALRLIKDNQQIFIDAFNRVKEGKKVKTLTLK